MKPQGEAWNKFTLMADGTNTADNLLLDFWPLELGDRKFLLFNPPSMWYYSTAALEN